MYHPGDFTPSNVRLTAVETAEEKARHEEEIRVEQVLKVQSIETIPSEYIDSLRDHDTSMLIESIPTIMSYLQKSYYRITPEQLWEMEQTMKRLYYDPDTHVNIIFNAI